MSVADGVGAANKTKHKHQIKILHVILHVQLYERLLAYKSTDQKTRELAKEQHRYEHKQLLSAQILEYDAACHLVVFRFE